MSQTLTISAPLAMSAVPALMLVGGLIVGVFLRADLATSIEAARLVADNDKRTARWLFQRGYRKTPHAGPDLTEGLAALADAVRAEQQPPALSDFPHHDDEDAPGDDTERPYLWALVIAVAVWAPCAAARRQLKALWGYVRERLQSDDARAAEWSQPAEAEYAGRRRCDEQSVNAAYSGRRVHPDFQTGVFPLVVIPAQREGGDL